MKHMVQRGNIALALLLSLLLALGGMAVAFAAGTQNTELPSYIQNSAEKAVWMDACPADGTSGIDAVNGTSTATVFIISCSRHPLT